MQLSSALELQRELVEQLALGTGLRSERTRPDEVIGRRWTELGDVRPDIAIGVGADGRGGYRLALRVQRRDLLASPRIAAICERARDEVDVQYIGLVTKFQSRVRPLAVGVSVAHEDITAGTLGCFVRTGDGADAILSNNHVLADENRASVGDAILQPGPADGGSAPDDVVARLAAFVELQTTGVNRLDAAVATLVEGIDFDPATLPGGQRLDAAVLAPEDADAVEKVGRTTGHTRGRVAAFNVIGVTVAYDIAPLLRFDGQIEVHSAGSEPFGRPGDSGSVIYSADGRRPVGLLFAGSDQGGAGNLGVTFANPIGEALGELDLSLLP